MKTNELRKGDRVQLANGWWAVIKDNRKGNTRLAEVHGFYTEIGSVYAHDIVAYFPEGEPSVKIVHTPAQIKLRNTVSFF